MRQLTMKIDQANNNSITNYWSSNLKHKHKQQLITNKQLPKVYTKYDRLSQDLDMRTYISSTITDIGLQTLKPIIQIG